MKFYHTYFKSIIYKYIFSTLKSPFFNFYFNNLNKFFMLKSLKKFIKLNFIKSKNEKFKMEK